MNFIRLKAVMLAVAIFTVPCLVIAQENGPLPAESNTSETASTNTMQPLSPGALDALVAGIALYPDQTIEQALAAAYDPQAVRAAAELSPQQFQQQGGQFDSSIQYLYAKEPALLDEMNQHLTLTARLGIAAQTQLDDVWAAVDRVRQKYADAQNTTDGSAEDAPADQVYATESTTGSAVYPYGAFAAGLVAGNVWHEIYHGYPYYAYHPHATAYVGPHGGTVAGGGRGAVYQNGNTTIGGKSGTVVVNGPNGTTGVAHGQGVAGATTYGNTTTFGSAASGSVATSNGLYAAGAHQGAGHVTTNPDGSVSFNRNATSGVTSNYGTTVVDHSGSGTYTGQGTGSYNGSTDINSTHGDASINTTAGGGQASTTVTTQNNSQTFTAGVGQVGSSSTARTARPSGMQSDNTAWVNSLAASQRQQLSKQTWGQMDRQAQNSFTGRNGQPVNQLDSRRTETTPRTERPSTARPGGASNFGSGSFSDRANSLQRNPSGTDGLNRNSLGQSRPGSSSPRSFSGGAGSRGGAGGRGRR